ncbi:MAG: Gfo/Idh/MocA family oxidoreductase [Chlorobia bacterium]|nr:Gfo/Idh/MocA family oxidoreductase [Fimbriimonadaceae bacterium]
MRGVVVGAGGMGRAWGKNLHEEGYLAGWVDIRPGAAAEASRALEADIAFGIDLDQVIEKASPDFLVDASPPEAHREVTTMALSRGLPVLGEKPMAASIEDGRAMVETSERVGKLYMVSQSRRYDPGFVAYRKLICENLGQIGILNVDFSIGAHFGGFRDEMDHVLLLDMAIHTFDQARALTKADPVSVYAEEFNPSWSWYRGNASANCLFEMSNGLRFAYRGSWCSEGLPSSWDGDWRAVGEHGTAIWEKNSVPVAEITCGDDGFHRPTRRIEEPPADFYHGIKGSLKEFIDALENGTVPQGECHDNLKSLAMVFAAVNSAKRGERVAVHI